MSGRQPMVREKILVVRGEIWTLFTIFVYYAVSLYYFKQTATNITLIILL
jgi:hypothetical protein